MLAMDQETDQIVYEAAHVQPQVLAISVRVTLAMCEQMLRSLVGCDLGELHEP